MQRDYQPLNDTVKTLELRLTYQPLSLFRWQLYAAQAMRNKWTSSFMGKANKFFLQHFVAFFTYAYVSGLNLYFLLSKE